MSKRGATQIPARVRIMTREGEAFVTSIWQAGEFHVTPCIGPATSTALVEALDQRWTRFDPCSVTHEPSGRLMILLEGKEQVTSMSLALAKAFAGELAARPGAVAAEESPAGFGANRALVEEASQAALAAYQRKPKASALRVVRDGS